MFDFQKLKKWVMESPIQVAIIVLFILTALFISAVCNAQQYRIDGLYSGSPFVDGDSPVGQGVFSKPLNIQSSGGINFFGASLSVFTWRCTQSPPDLCRPEAYYLIGSVIFSGATQSFMLCEVQPTSEFLTFGVPDESNAIAKNQGLCWPARLTVLDGVCVDVLEICPSPLPTNAGIVTSINVTWLEGDNLRSLTLSERL